MALTLPKTVSVSCWFQRVQPFSIMASDRLQIIPHVDLLKFVDKYQLEIIVRRSYRIFLANQNPFSEVTFLWTLTIEPVEIMFQVLDT